MLSVSVVFSAFLVLGLNPKLKSNKSTLVEFSTVFLLLVLILVSDFSKIGVFIKHVCLFHLGEWTFVRTFHRESLSFDSFLINNSKAYVGCLLLSVAEYKMSAIFSTDCTTYIGLTIASVGLLIRWFALYTGGRNFTHMIAHEKRQEHQLVTTGIYSFSRHPGYSGWFWWTVGLQVLLGNPVCTVVFTWLSWRFFKERIHYEERLLVEFFGLQYLSYREKTGVLIPFL